MIVVDPVLSRRPVLVGRFVCGEFGFGRLLRRERTEHDEEAGEVASEQA
jgi:hypothetical protein